MYVILIWLNSTSSIFMLSILRSLFRNPLSFFLIWYTRHTTLWIPVTIGNSFCDTCLSCLLFAIWTIGTTNSTTTKFTIYWSNSFVTIYSKLTPSVSLESCPELSDSHAITELWKQVSDNHTKCWFTMYCTTFATFLGLPREMVNNKWYAADARIVPKCQKLVERWLEGNGKPVKWETVLEVLQKVYPILVEDLKSCII